MIPILICIFLTTREIEYIFYMANDKHFLSLKLFVLCVNTNRKIPILVLLYYLMYVCVQIYN